MRIKLNSKGKDGEIQGGETYLSHPHAIGVRVAAKEDHDESLLLAEDGLVDVPAAPKMRKKDRTHIRYWVDGDSTGLCVGKIPMTIDQQLGGSDCWRRGDGMPSPQHYR